MSVSTHVSEGETAQANVSTRLICDSLLLFLRVNFSPNNKFLEFNQMDFGKIYFFTATIKGWFPLLEMKGLKEIILESLYFLSAKNLIEVYGFVIMPNHIHILWELRKENGKESPHSSFLKFTGHRFLEILKKEDPYLLSKFRVNDANRSHIFWQRDSLPVEVYTNEIVYQKLDYIHKNPCSKKWMLVDNPVEYPYSSFEFYETGKDRFGFLLHIGERI